VISSTEWKDIVELSSCSDKYTFNFILGLANEKSLSLSGAQRGNEGG